MHVTPVGRRDAEDAEDAETLRTQRTQRRDAEKYTSGMSFALTIATLSKQLANLIL